MKDFSRINLIMRGGNVYSFWKNEIECIGRIGCPATNVRGLRKIINKTSNYGVLIESRLKSQRIVRKGYLPLKKSELKRIHSSFIKRAPYRGLELSY